jgi:7,8-dihydropterin-6-yl-methyl-4-(beta-D-ribofuranosyl)aminobenzene 5'-phosphate synthase
MKIATLVENTSISPEYGCEHGLSFYIETAAHRLLFDLGEDDLFLRNAEKLGVDIGAVDTVVISHGHCDHGGALGLFLERNRAARVYVRENAFLPYFSMRPEGTECIGLDASLKNHAQVVLTGEDCAIDDELRLFSGVTERECDSRTNDSLCREVAGRLVRTTSGMNKIWLSPKTAR